MNEDARPLILTLKLDDSSFARFDDLRRRHFPAALNHLSAHLTLFHKLDGARLGDTLSVVNQAVRRPAVALSFTGLRRLGRGVAYAIRSPELDALRARIADVFRQDLTPQDRQGFKPHVTVQNKVAPAEAEALYGELAAGFVPWEGRGEALLLWRYLGGPWSLEAEVSFRG